MAEFDVVVERVAPGSIGTPAIARLATAMGTDPARLAERLVKGPVRVRQRVIRDQAELTKGQLETLGFRAQIVAHGADVSPPQTAPRSASGLSYAETSSADHSPPAARSDANLSALDHAASAVSDEQEQSLRAALEGGLSASALGTLDGVDSSVIDAAAGASEFADGDPSVVAGTSPGADRFAPPEDDEAPLLLEVEVASPVTPEAVPTENEVEVEPPDEPVLRPSDAERRPTTTSLAMVGPPALQKLRERAEAQPRTLAAAGILLALFLGFWPASLIGSARERSSYGEVIEQVERAFANVTSQEAWEALDPYVAKQADRLRSARLRIAGMTWLSWWGISAALAWAWFRFVLFR